MKSLPKISSLIFLVIFTACTVNNNLSDAFGNFEANEVIISAESQGKIIALNINEGQRIVAGKQIGVIDTTQLVLTKKQVIAQKEATATNVASIKGEISVHQKKLENLYREKKRVEKLFQDNAATDKQLDDINGNIDVIKATINSIGTKIKTVEMQEKALARQIDLINDKINSCKIINPLSGTILEKYVEKYELAIPGKPLYKIADLNEMTLRVYVSGAQLPQIKIGRQVEVLIDKNDKLNQKLDGKVLWIASQAEFTPKIIQTKKERVNLVYAVKILVRNDGRIKIGMPGEVNFLDD